MASTFLKVGKIARMSLGLLLRELVIAKTVWADAVGGDEFIGALNDTVTIRVPAIGQPARTRTLRAGTPITNDDLVEYGIGVQLTTDVYKGVPVSDEQLTLDITDFGEQVLRPQVQAVAEKVEDLIAAAIEGATYVSPITIATDDPYLAFVDARSALNDAKVPRASRFLLAGSNVEAWLLKSDRLKPLDNPIGESAFADAALGRIAGFTVVGTSAIDPNSAYAYHRSAFILATRAPKVPDGVSMGQGISGEGLAMRWIKDYDYANTTDRSLVNTWVGTKVVEDSEDPTDPTPTTALVRAVQLEIPS